jgi:hypothetical protein
VDLLQRLHIAVFVAGLTRRVLADDQRAVLDESRKGRFDRRERQSIALGRRERGEGTAIAGIAANDASMATCRASSAAVLADVAAAVLPTVAPPVASTRA